MAAGVAAVAAFAPFSAAADKTPAKPAATAVTPKLSAIEDRHTALAAMVARQDAAARRALENARELAGDKRTDSSDEAVVASAVVKSWPASGELLRSTGSTAAPKTRTLRMLVTAYCSCTKCCGANAQGITASGKRVSYNQGRFVAADKKLLPFGTKLKIPGYHGGIPVEVTDTGSAIKGNRIDVYFPSHQQALEWGRQWLEVEVSE